MAQKINQTQFSTKYSTTEQLTGDVWIDGKPIYRKVINFGTLPNNGQKDVAHGITGLDRMIDLYGMASAGTTQLPTSYSHPTSPYQFYIVGVNVRCVTSSDRTTFSAYVVLEYTKT